MTSNKPTKKELEALGKQIKHDQAQVNPAEKRLKINTTFKEAIKKMGQTPPKKERE